MLKKKKKIKRRIILKLAFTNINSFGKIILCDLFCVSLLLLIVSILRHSDRNNAVWFLVPSFRYHSSRFSLPVTLSHRASPKQKQTDRQRERESEQGKEKTKIFSLKFNKRCLRCRLVSNVLMLIKLVNVYIFLWFFFDQFDHFDSIRYLYTLIIDKQHYTMRYNLTF